MKIIVGLGNPGKKYEKTRHNKGFEYVDKIASQNMLDWKFNKKFNSEIAEFIVDGVGDGLLINNTTIDLNDGEKVILVKPQTLMTKSGNAVSKIVDFSPEQVVLQFDRGAAGHKGVQSIIDKLGSKKFWRLRVGVGNPPEDSGISVEDWVLMKEN